jgi:DNA-binding NarL/FixJ family response regulator
MSNPIRIMLADDHELVLEGLRALLQAEPDMEVLGAFTNGEKLLEVARRLKPDIVVVDWQMRIGALDIVQRIRAEQLPIKVMILTAFEDGEELRLAWEHGAEGYAFKTDPPRQTVAAIRNVAHGSLVFPAAARSDRVRKASEKNPLDTLSDRECEFLELVAEGMTNAEIAQRLSVSAHTVKFHLQNIFQKLHVGNRTEAAHLYHQWRERR